MQIAITSNLVDFIKSIQSVTRDQIPFATARALTRTAQDVRARAVVEERARFKIRRPFMTTVWRVEGATKDNLEAKFGLTERGAAILGKFEKGADKTPKAGVAIAVPTANVPEGGDRRVPKSLQPETGAQTTPSAKQARYKKLNLFRIGGTIFVRFGGQIQPVFALTPKAVIKPRLGVHEWGPAEVQRRWPGNFQASLIDALKTRK